MLITLRSVLFNIAFYLCILIWLIIALPTFLMPYCAIMVVAKAWGRTNLFLLRTICDLGADFRGLRNIPKGPLIVAAKHQSAWETFSLLWLLDDPVFILKRELQWIPLFGWFTIKGRMVPVDRGGGSQALADMTERVRAEMARGRQIIIFPEGTRRPPGAEPKYKFGVAHLYAACGVPCVPIALNSGLFWPRRSIRRLPGTVLAEVLDPIPPGLDKQMFFDRLRDTLEAASARLIAEGQQEIARRLS
ncbi:MAG: lysophospholipid acyltransferase family protein [Pseudolabrys sp.]